MSEVTFYMCSDEKKILMKHNDIVKSKYEITVNSNRIFTYLLYAFQRDSDERKLVCEVSRADLAKLVNGNVDKTAKGLTTILMNLRKKDLHLMERLSDGSIDYIAGGFIDNAIYNDKTDIFKIFADKRIHRLLHEYLDDGYTPINLEIWLSLKNRYAQRFYDILRAWSGTKDIINYRVDTLRELLCLGNKYKQYTDFRKRVLIPAIDELNSTGYFLIDYSEVKKGRIVESIDFVVKDLDKRKYFVQDNIMVINSISKDEGTTPTPTVNKDLYVPDEEVFTKGTLRSFRKDFKDIDFKNEYMLKAFDDAVMIVLDRDDTDTIKAMSYKFFKGTLSNKIVEYRLEEQEDLKHKNEIEMYW